MELTTHVDLTIPLWGVIGAVSYGIYHVIRLTAKVTTLEATLEKLTEQIEEFIKMRRQ